jgi:hypothetical protein
MFQATLAPVLSATSKLERTCNIKSSNLGRDCGLHGALDDFDQASSA